ncbi:MAG: hypothetical protein NZM65_09865, partial [Flavobacteriales bacterium]|nr:hypothetical protein [Flavobacteriales bacterium]MDW8410977.1 hypothetical protein [Flavobacteriales bacterium]
KAEEEARRKAEEEARRKAEEEAAAEAERLRKLRESEKTASNTYIILRKYTTGTSKYYGYINFGNGTGNHNLTEEEYHEYYKKYRLLIRD